MNPYQQGQPGYPTQQVHNVGFGINTPHLGNQMPMPGLPTMGYPQAPQPSAPSYVQGHHQSQGYPQLGYSQQSAQPGYPQINYQPGCAQGNIQPGYPQGNAQPGYPQGNTQPGFAQGNFQPGYPQGNAQLGQQGNVQPGYPQINPHQGFLPHCGNVQNMAYGVSPIPQFKPTVVAACPFFPEKDATALRDAMKMLGTNEKAIIQVLTRRTNEQRQKIAAQFSALYGKNLIMQLKSETSGHFRDLLVALMTPLPQFYAKELHNAIAGIGTNESALLDIMCTVNNHEINVIKQAYTDMYKKPLEDDLRADTSGYLKKFLTILCSNDRDQRSFVDKKKAKEDASSLFKAGEDRFGTDETVFNLIFGSRSYPQLAAVFQEYQILTGHDVSEAIKSEFSGYIKRALLTMVQVVRNKPAFFAERLHNSMKGAGTKDRQLIRIMVTRSEVDLGDISDMFQKKYNATLQSWIEGDCSGHYKKCLLGLLGLY